MMTEIRSMEPGDWDQVRRIYLEGLATGLATFETEAPSWEQWDASHLPFARLVAASGSSIKGWAALSAVSSRAVYSGVAEVSVYVAEEYRGKGVGKSLLKQLIEASERNGVWTLQASIFPENEASVSLHRACGFREVGRRVLIAQLNEVWRDTVLMERRK